MKLSSIFTLGGLLGSGRSAPETSLEKDAKQFAERLQGRKVEPIAAADAHSSTYSTFNTLKAGVSVMTAGASIVSGARQLYQSATSVLPSEPASTMANATTAAASTAGKVSSFVVDGGTDLYGWAKLGWNIGSWGFGLLPPGIKLAVGIGGLYYAYKFFRSNSRSSSGCCAAPQVNVYGQCRVTHSGNRVDVDCTSQVQEKKANASKKIVETAEKVRTKLQDHLTNQGRLLSDAVKKTTAEIISQFDDAKKKQYNDKGIFSLIRIAQEHQKVIDKELRSHALKTARHIAAGKVVAASTSEQLQEFKRIAIEKEKARMASRA